MPRWLLSTGKILSPPYRMLHVFYVLIYVMLSAAEGSVASRYELEGMWKEEVVSSFEVSFGQRFETL